MEKKMYFAPETKVRISALQTYMQSISDRYTDDGDPLTDQDFSWDSKEERQVGDNNIW